MLYTFSSPILTPLSNVSPPVLYPSLSTHFSQLSREAGIPSGVFNVVTGSRQSAEELGKALTSSDLVAKLSFTGSTAVGKVGHSRDEGGRAGGVHSSTRFWVLSSFLCTVPLQMLIPT